MKAVVLYQMLEEEFELHKRREDEWSSLDLGEHITENFKNRFMGVVLDHSEEIQKVYTAVFPSELVLDRILSKGEKNVVLFTHHPMIWDRTIEGFPFRNIPENYLEKMKEQAISLYTLHSPLDRNGPFGTSASLARALKVEKEREFFDYMGSMVGIIGKTSCKTVSELGELVQVTVGHEIKVWNYGTPDIDNHNVAVVAGGGNFPEIIEELVETDVRMYVTGITRRNPDWEPSIKFHDLCKEYGFNVIGATHYSTEKFACIAIQKFFDSLGLPSEFLEDGPEFRDYE